MGTPKTDPDYEHSEAALREEQADAVIACLGDDAQLLRLANQECEIADNMEAAADLIEALRDEVRELSMALHMTESTVAVAVATERQACVKECELVWMHTSGDAAKQCATAIRRRSKDELQDMERRDALGPWEDRA